MKKNILISLGLLVVAAIGFFLILPRPNEETPPVVDPIELNSPSPVPSNEAVTEPDLGSFDNPEQVVSAVAQAAQSFWNTFIAATDPNGNAQASADLHSLLASDLQSQIPEDTLKTPVAIAQKLNLNILPNSAQVRSVSKLSDTEYRSEALLSIPNQAQQEKNLTLVLQNGSWKVSSL